MEADEKVGSRRKRRRSSEDIEAFIAENIDALKERYGTSHRVINWEDKQVRYHFAIQAGLISESEVKMDRVSQARLVMLLSNCIDGDFWKTSNFNYLLVSALEKGFIGQEDFDASFTGKIQSIKCYLKTVVDDRDVICKLKEYSTVCSELMIRGAITANLMASYAVLHGRTDEMFEMLTKLKMRQNILPEFFKPEARSALLNDVLNECADCILPCPDWESVMSRSGWDNGLKYLAGKYTTAVQNHILVHIGRRIKKYIDVTCSNPDLCKARFFQGESDSPLTPQDQAIIRQLRVPFGALTGEWTPPSSVTKRVFEFHIRLLTEVPEAIKASLFPISSWTRGHHRACARVFDHLMKAAHTSVSFSSIFCKDRIRIKLSDSRRRKRKAIRSRMRGRAWQQRRRTVQHSFINLKKGARITSIETDGCALSMCVSTPIEASNSFSAPPQETKKKTKAELERMRLQRTEDFRRSVDVKSSILAGVDVGRRNFYAIAFKSPAGVASVPALQFHRAEWLKMIRDRKHKAFYKEKDALEDTRELLINIGETTKKTSDFETFKKYARVVCDSISTIRTRFLQDDDRLYVKMKSFRLRRSAMHRLCNRIFRHVDKYVPSKTPLVLATGPATFGGGAVKGERSSVPVKEMLRYLKDSFRRLARVGRFYQHIDEYYTTKMCSVHKSTTSDYHQKNSRGHKKKWLNVNVRHCAQCASENNVLGLIDRDGNAAQNILLILECILRGLPRPEYLCRVAKEASKKTRAKRSRVASSSG
jgi:hypothetical protein